MGKGLKATAAVFVAPVVTAARAVYFCFPGFLLDCVKKAIRWEAGLSRHTIEVDDHRWVYLEGGKGETILLLHGFGMEKDGWGLFPRAFSRSYRVILPDLPGFGENSRLESSNYDVSSQVKRLNRFLESLKLDSFHLAGSSMGGYIAGYYASEYPQKVKSVALFNPAGVNSPVPSDLWRRYMEKGENALVYKTREGFEDILRLLFYRVPPVPGPFKAYFAKLGALHHAFYRKALRDLENGGIDKLEARLSRVEARTLVVWGANDRILHVSGAEIFKRGLRDGTVVILDQCGHAPFFEKREETAKIYRDFLASRK